MTDRDVRVPPGPGLPRGLVVRAQELSERFTRAGGPGGQGVNTTDSRVQLSLDLARCPGLDDVQRTRLLERLAGRLTDGVLTVTASTYRAQARNREAARARMAEVLAEALRPPRKAPVLRRPLKRASARRVEGKRRRGEVKAARRRPAPGGSD